MITSFSFAAGTHPNAPRKAVAEYLQRRRNHNPKYTILDIGGSIPTEGVPADFVLDFTHPLSTSDQRFQCLPNVTYFCGDISTPEGWEEIREYVNKNGKFDFCFCSHTLEDVENPIWVCRNIEIIAKEGYIATPSKYVELGRICGPFRGYYHHRWIMDISGDMSLVCYPKYNWIEYIQEFDSMLDRSREDLAFFWVSSIPIVEFHPNKQNGSPTESIRDYVMALTAKSWFDAR